MNEFRRMIDDLQCLFEDTEAEFVRIDETCEEECESILKTIPDNYLSDLAKAKIFFHRAKRIVDDIWDDTRPAGGAND